jgi:hypothetical protein
MQWLPCARRCSAAFAFHNSYRSFGDSVCGRDIRPAGKARSESQPAARRAIAVPQHRRGGSGARDPHLEQRAVLSPSAVAYKGACPVGPAPAGGRRGLASRRRRPAPAQRRPFDPLRSSGARKAAPKTILINRCDRGALSSLLRDGTNATFSGSGPTPQSCPQNSGTVSGTDGRHPLPDPDPWTRSEPR